MSPGAPRAWGAGLAASLVLHALAVALMVAAPEPDRTPPPGIEDASLEVELVPPPAAPQAPEVAPAPAPEPPAPEEAEAEAPAAVPEPEPAPEPEPVPEPDSVPEPELEPVPEPEPEEAEDAPQPEADSVRTLQAVEEFAEEARPAEGTESARDGAPLPFEDAPSAENAGEATAAADAGETAGEPAAASREEGDVPAGDMGAEDAATETTGGAEDEAPATDTALDALSPEAGTGAEDGRTDTETADTETPETADGETGDTENAETETTETGTEDLAPEAESAEGPKALGDVASEGETAVDADPASAPDGEGPFAAIAAAAPRAKPVPQPDPVLRDLARTAPGAPGRAVEDETLPPGVRLPGRAVDLTPPGGGPRSGPGQELFSDQILGGARGRTAMAGLSGPQRLNLLCVTELRAQISSLYPDRPAELLPSFRPAPGTVLEPARAAYRSRGQWYELNFRCETDPGVTRVERFSFRVGPPVPRSQWRARGFPAR